MANIGVGLMLRVLGVCVSVGAVLVATVLPSVATAAVECLNGSYCDTATWDPDSGTLRVVVNSPVRHVIEPAPDGSGTFSLGSKAGMLDLDLPRVPFDEVEHVELRYVNPFSTELHVYGDSPALDRSDPMTFHVVTTSVRAQQTLELYLGAGGGSASTTSQDIRGRGDGFDLTGDGIPEVTLSRGVFLGVVHLVGSSADDRVDLRRLTPRRNVRIEAELHGGDDRFWSLGRSKDRVDGGPGNDVIWTFNDADYVLGGLGSDVIRGGAMADTLIGSDDANSRGDGNDVIFGEGGKDRLMGGYGFDRVFGGPGDDHLSAWGRNLMVGGPGSEYIMSELGGRMLGGPGNDFLTMQPLTRSYVDCGPGLDTTVTPFPNSRVLRCEASRFATTDG